MTGLADHAHDPFRPLHALPRAIYDAFQAEATKRKSRSVEEWTAAEEQAVLAAATKGASAEGLSEPTLAMVQRAQRYAMGSVDYGSKWAHTLVNIMQRTARGEVF